jgi:SAM-dependent methyltransferase
MTAETTRPGEYILDNAADGERDRLRALETAYDPRTRERLIQLGLGPGCRVLLLGAGGGGIIPWLAEQVGPAGRIVATDIDPRFLRPLAEEYDTLDVLAHNIVTDDLPDEPFDIIQSRLLLAHLPAREQVLAKLVAALAPGGRLLIEEWDWGSYGPAFPSPEAQRTIDAFTQFGVSYGFEPYLGRRLPTIFRRLGLEQVDAIGHVLTYRGENSPIEPIYRQTFKRLIPAVLNAGLLTTEDVEGFFERFDDPEYDFTTQTMMSVWGYKAPASAHPEAGLG